MRERHLRLAVVVVSKGRPTIVGDVVASLTRQNRPADEVWLAVPTVEDLPPGIDSQPGVHVLLAPAGITSQRNAVLDAVSPDVDLLVFLDDDVELHPDFLAAAERFAVARDDVALFMGRVVRDGAATGEVSRVDARRELAQRSPGTSVREGVHAYGCNMVVRRAVACAVRFDPELPLYGYLEDRDFGVRVRRHGAVVEHAGCELVHLGAGSGRSSGLRLGYQQVVHPLYLRAKGTLTTGQTAYLVARVLVANAVGGRATRVDRPGRLRGNLIGLRESVRHGPQPSGVHRLRA